MLPDQNAASAKCELPSLGKPSDNSKSNLGSTSQLPKLTLTNILLQFTHNPTNK